jgi:hypothetical protein
MTPDKPSLAEFLPARIDEDEEAGRRDFGPDETVGTWTAWVLAECEAKRRIMNLHSDVLDHGFGDIRHTGMCKTCVVGPDEFAPYPCDTLRALALPYAYYPDYQPEWRP